MTLGARKMTPGERTMSLGQGTGVIFLDTVSMGRRTVRLMVTSQRP